MIEVNEDCYFSIRRDIWHQCKKFATEFTYDVCFCSCCNVIDFSSANYVSSIITNNLNKYDTASIVFRDGKNNGDVAHIRFFVNKAYTWGQK